MTITARLILGHPDLLTGRPLRDTDLLTLATLPAQAATSPPNTVILRWADLYPTDLIARTVDGRHATRTNPGLGPLFDTLQPAPALRHLVQTITLDAHGWPIAPLLYTIAIPGTDGLNLYVYSPVEYGVEDICLLRLTPHALPAKDLDDVSWLSTALRLHTEQTASLNNHECGWRKAFPGQELEHKYTLPPDTPIWELTVDTLHQIRHGCLPGFALKYHDELQAWNYDNYLYDIQEPEAERGYVSFIPTATGDGWRMKRKWFTADTFARREQLTNLTMGTDLAAFLRETLRVDALPMPAFRRLRYDVNVESLATGHYYGIFFDRCHLLDDPTVALSQCEIEYCRTRTTQRPDEASILHEIDHVANWIETLLITHDITAPRGYYSKLSFLRDTLDSHPQLSVPPVPRERNGTVASLTHTGEPALRMTLSWEQLCRTVTHLCELVSRDQQPDVVVGILRGGMIPAVLIAHGLGSRSLRAVDITHTTDDSVNAAKTDKPLVRNPDTLGNLTGLDVLIIDDVAGTGDTIAAAETLVRHAGAARVRTLACVVNQRNWRAARSGKPDEALTYIGMIVEGWVIFPWETQ